MVGKENMAKAIIFIAANVSINTIVAFVLKTTIVFMEMLAAEFFLKHSNLSNIRLSKKYKATKNIEWLYIIYLMISVLL